MDATRLMSTALAEKKAERLALDKEICEIETALAVIARYSGSLTSQEPLQEQRATDAAGPFKVQVMTAAANILGTDGPMQMRELKSKLAELGLEMPGMDPDAYLSTLLSRNKAEYGLTVDRRLGWMTVVQAKTLDEFAGTAKKFQEPGNPRLQNADQSGDVHVTHKE